MHQISQQAFLFLQPFQLHVDFVERVLEYVISVIIE